MILESRASRTPPWNPARSARIVEKRQQMSAEPMPISS